MTSLNLLSASLIHSKHRAENTCFPRGQLGIEVLIVSLLPVFPLLWNVEAALHAASRRSVPVSYCSGKLKFSTKNPINIAPLPFCTLRSKVALAFRLPNTLHTVAAGVSVETRLTLHKALVLNTECRFLPQPWLATTAGKKKKKRKEVMYLQLENISKGGWWLSKGRKSTTMLWLVLSFHPRHAP